MKSRKTLFLFIIPLLLAVATFSSSFKNLTEPPPSKKHNSLLWKVEGNGIKSSYLFGTIHVIPQKDFRLKATVREAFAAADQVVLELNADGMMAQLEIMQKAVMKDGVTLEKLLTPEEYARVDEAAKPILGGIAPVKSIAPIITSMLFLMDVLGSQPASYEQTFTRMAKEANKDVLGLETIDEQVGIFHSIPYQIQAKTLLEFVDNKSEMEAQFVKMVELYTAEDIEELYKYSSSEFEESGMDIKMMLDDRNEKWIPRMDKMAKDKSCFFAVGAGHLGGKMGVISLLKAAGYKVTPLH